MRSKVKSVLVLLAVLFVSSPLAAEPETYLAPGVQHLGSEWSLAYSEPSLGAWKQLGFLLSYGPADWLPRFLAGAAVDHGFLGSVFTGVELPLIETEQGNSNARGFGLFLRGTASLDFKLRTSAAIGMGMVYAWAGISGPGINASFTTDGTFLISVTLNGAVGLREVLQRSES